MSSWVEAVATKLYEIGHQLAVFGDYQTFVGVPIVESGKQILYLSRPC